MERQVNMVHQTPWAEKAVTMAHTDDEDRKSQYDSPGPKHAKKAYLKNAQIETTMMMQVSMKK